MPPTIGSVYKEWQTAETSHKLQWSGDESSNRPLNEQLQQSIVLAFVFRDTQRINIHCFFNNS